jgi:hypothetical protein
MVAGLDYNYVSKQLNNSDYSQIIETTPTLSPTLSKIEAILLVDWRHGAKSIFAYFSRHR